MKPEIVTSHHVTPGRKPAPLGGFTPSEIRKNPGKTLSNLEDRQIVEELLVASHEQWSSVFDLREKVYQRELTLGDLTEFINALQRATHAFSSIQGRLIRERTKQLELEGLLPSPRENQIEF